MKLQAAARLQANADFTEVVAEAEKHFKSKPIDNGQDFVLFKIPGMGEVDVGTVSGRVTLEFIPDSKLATQGFFSSVASMGTSFKDALAKLHEKFASYKQDQVNTYKQLEKQLAESKGRIKLHDSIIKAI